MKQTFVSYWTDPNKTGFRPPEDDPLSLKKIIKIHAIVPEISLDKQKKSL